MPTMTRPTLPVQLRKILGRSVKKLRTEKKIPGNIFGKKIASTAVVADDRAFEKLFRTVGTTSLVDLSVQGEKNVRPVLVSQVQRHPVTDRILHVDFRQVDLAEKVTATVPLRLIGEAPAVRDKGAILVTVHPELQVEALPMDLPDRLEADVSVLMEIGNSIRVRDLKVDRSKVTIGLADDETIVIAQEPKKEEEAPAPAVAEAAPAEGEAPAAEGGSREAGSSTKPEEKKEQGEKKQEVAKKQ